MDFDDVATYYKLIGTGVGAVVGVVGWIYCTAHYGFLLGFGLGWLPSAILGILAGVFWPIALLIATMKVPEIRAILAEIHAAWVAFR